MAATDSYFRFPLAALATPGTPIEMLDAIIDYSIVSAGIGLERNSPEAFQLSACAQPVGQEPARASDRAWWQRVCAGAHLTGVKVYDWKRTKAAFDKLSSQIADLGLKSALVTIRAAWVWNTLDTLLEEEGRQARNEHHGWMTWREFRVMAAVLSVIGAKPYAWISTATLRHRVCGYTSAASISGRRIRSACPVLTRRMIETTLGRLETNRFFLRCRVSGNPLGRGGRTAYSVRHESREALIADLRKTRPQAENRRQDHALWTAAATTSRQVP